MNKKELTNKVNELEKVISKNKTEKLLWYERKREMNDEICKLSDEVGHLGNVIDELSNVSNDYMHTNIQLRSNVFMLKEIIKESMREM